MDNNSLDKNKSENLEINSEIKPEKKKRGRKPKNVGEVNDDKRVQTIKTKTVINKDNIPKKRGRKPKIEKVITSHKELDTSSNIILHLPINFSKKEDFPNGFDENQSFYEIKNTLKKKIKNIEPNINLNDYIKERNEIYNQNNIIFLRYDECNKKKEWPKTTNYDCLWDSHPFSNIPCGIPIKKNNNIVYMFGNFCSPECAAAYCFTMNDNIWEKYSLLNEIYGIMEPVRIANSKLLLKKFGGIYSIDEFRSLNINNSKMYKVCLPPTIALIPTLEETNIDINDKIYIENNELKKINKYKLKKNKPVNDSNSLENIMNLKYL